MMSNLQIIEELCHICSMQAEIIVKQTMALEQLGAVAMEEERAEVAKCYRLLGEEPALDPGLV